MKVNARKVEDDGIAFDSATEHERYCELRMLQRAGEISKLQAHPEFVFIVNGVTVGKMKPDFSYLDKQNAVHIEDAKGWKKSPRRTCMPKRIPVIPKVVRYGKNIRS